MTQRAARRIYAMKTYQRRRLLGPLFLLLVLLASTMGPPAPANDQAIQAPPGAEKIAPELHAEMAALAPGEMVTAIVTMRDQAGLSRIPGAAAGGHSRAAGAGGSVATADPGVPASTAGAGQGWQ
jgi:hypothetical protein